MKMQVANTIYQQLGGGKFAVMTGAKNFLGSDNGLSFKVGRNAGKITHVKITLEPSDTYTVKFLAVRGTNIKEVAERDGVYFDGLCQVFESITGLRTSI